jgi:hypothetical protein
MAGWPRCPLAVAVTGAARAAAGEDGGNVGRSADDERGRTCGARRARPPAFRLLMRLQGIGDASSVSRAELNAYLALVKGQDKGRAFQQTS